MFTEDESEHSLKEALLSRSYDLTERLAANLTGSYDSGSGEILASAAEADYLGRPVLLFEICSSQQQGKYKCMSIRRLFAELTETLSGRESETEDRTQRDPEARDDDEVAILEEIDFAGDKTSAEDEAMKVGAVRSRSVDKYARAISGDGQMTWGSLKNPAELERNYMTKFARHSDQQAIPEDQAAIFKQVSFGSDDDLHIDETSKLLSPSSGSEGQDDYLSKFKGLDPSARRTSVRPRRKTLRASLGPTLHKPSEIGLSKDNLFNSWVGKQVSAISSIQDTIQGVGMQGSIQDSPNDPALKLVGAYGKTLSENELAAQYGNPVHPSNTDIMENVPASLLSRISCFKSQIMPPSALRETKRDQKRKNAYAPSNSEKRTPFGVFRRRRERLQLERVERERQISNISDAMRLESIESVVTPFVSSVGGIRPAATPFAGSYPGYDELHGLQTDMHSQITSQNGTGMLGYKRRQQGKVDMGVVKLGSLSHSLQASADAVDFSVRNGSSVDLSFALHNDSSEDLTRVTGGNLGTASTEAKFKSQQKKGKVRILVPLSTRHQHVR
jgi:hypothetical protein